MIEDVLQRMKRLEMYIAKTGVTVDPESKESSDLYEAASSLLLVISRIRKNHVVSSELNVEDTAPLVAMERHTPGTVSGVYGLKRDLESLNLRILSIVVPLERYIGKEAAMMCRANPLENKEDISRSVSFYDERSLYRVLGMKWLLGVPSRISKLLAEWSAIEFQLCEYLQKLHEGEIK